jgi:uncharacterized RDD family membrane protein YckC
MSRPPPLSRRIVARVLDVLVCVAIDAGLGQAIGYGFDWLAIGAALVLLYFAGSLALTGTSVGKRLTGLEVVGVDGARPSPLAALRREAFTVLGAIPFAGPILALAAWTWIVLAIRRDPDGRGPHDRWAGTQLRARSIRAAR